MNKAQHLSSRDFMWPKIELTGVEATQFNIISSTNVYCSLIGTTDSLYLY